MIIKTLSHKFYFSYCLFMNLGRGQDNILLFYFLLFNSHFRNSIIAGKTAIKILSLKSGKSSFLKIFKFSKLKNQKFVRLASIHC